MPSTAARIKNPGLRRACTKLGISLIALVSLTCDGGREEPSRIEDPAVRVDVREVRPERVPEEYEAVGTVRPRLSATISAKVTAVVKEVLVKSGDAVRAGDLLAKLDDRELRAEFDRAHADNNRFKKLLERQAATRAEFEAVESRYRIAAAALSYASITAPFDGIVAQKSCDAGDLAVPGKPLFAVEQRGPFRLEASVPERFAWSVTVGKKVGVVIDATGEACSGTVGEIIPAADAATRSFLIRIDLECQERPTSGMFGRARLSVGERPGLFVPKAAVYQRGQLTYLFVEAQGRARMRLVKTGRDRAEAVEVLAGLEPGEQVIVSSHGQLKDGIPVDPR